MKSIDDSTDAMFPLSHEQKPMGTEASELLLLVLHISAWVSLGGAVAPAGEYRQLLDRPWAEKAKKGHGWKTGESLSIRGAYTPIIYSSTTDHRRCSSVDKDSREAKIAMRDPGDREDQAAFHYCPFIFMSFVHQSLFRFRNRKNKTQPTALSCYALTRFSMAYTHWPVFD